MPRCHWEWKPLGTELLGDVPLPPRVYLAAELGGWDWDTVCNANASPPPSVGYGHLHGKMSYYFFFISGRDTSFLKMEKSFERVSRKCLLIKTEALNKKSIDQDLKVTSKAFAL